MNRETLMDAIGQLPEEMLADVAKKRIKKKNHWIHWAALAACLSLVLTLPLTVGGGMKAANKADMEAPMEMAQDHVYSGSSYNDGSDLKLPTEHFLATVVEVHKTYLLVEPLKDQWEYASANRITVPIPNPQDPQEFTPGDLLQITYSGTLLESYPAQAVNVTGIERLG